MEEAINILHDRIGRYLSQPREDGTYVFEGGNVRCVPYIGTCQRTGLTGEIIDYPERRDGDHLRIRTLTRLLWLFKKYAIADKKGTVKSKRLGGGCVIAVIDDDILTTVTFERPIPNLRVMKRGDILRMIAGRRCLFLSFTDKPSAVLGNGLRWSFDEQLEVNGHLSINSSTVIQNTAINLGQAFAISRIGEKRLVYHLRRLLTLRERTDKAQEQLQKMVDDAVLPITALQMLFNAGNREMELAASLWES